MLEQCFRLDNQVLARHIYHFSDAGTVNRCATAPMERSKAKGKVVDLFFGSQLNLITSSTQ